MMSNAIGLILLVCTPRLLFRSPPSVSGVVPFLLLTSPLPTEGGLDATTTAHLNSSLTSNTKVDLVLTDALLDSPIAIDFTVSCPLLPSYVACHELIFPAAE